MRLFRGLRPLKRWRYVGVFCEQLMACAATVQIGPARQCFWALYLRGDAGGPLRERTHLLTRRGAVQLSGAHTSPSQAAPPPPGRLRVHDSGVMLDLQLQEGPGIEALCAHGREQVWTRKQAGCLAHGTLALDGAPPQAVRALAVIDDTAGYHARETEWRWSAGVGQTPAGVAVAWNLVAGVNDPPSGSERAVWVAGEPSEVPPVSFASDLSGVSCEDGSELHFRAETMRRRRDRLVLVASDYTAPFGVFWGTLPGGVPLGHGLGVMEHHRARW